MEYCVYPISRSLQVFERSRLAYDAHYEQRLNSYTNMSESGNDIDTALV
jgi:hypothetical protein